MTRTIDNFNSLDRRRHRAIPRYQVTTSEGYGVPILIPALIAGGTAIAGGIAGYFAGRPDIDPQTGERIPGAFEKGVDNVTQSIGTAIVLTAGGILAWKFFTRK